MWRCKRCGEDVDESVGACATLTDIGVELSAR